MSRLKLALKNAASDTSFFPFSYFMYFCHRDISINDLMYDAIRHLVTTYLLR